MEEKREVGDVMRCNAGIAAGVPKATEIPPSFLIFKSIKNINTLLPSVPELSFKTKRPNQVQEPALGTKEGGEVGAAL